LARRGNLFGLGGRPVGAKRKPAHLRRVSVALLFTAFALGQSNAVTDGDRSLKIYAIHTGQQETVVFKRDGVYDRAGLARLNYIVRDWRKNEIKQMDPHLFDLLWQVYQASGSTGAINVVCGYRSPDTNAMLRRRSKAVAQHSQHMLGKAMDFNIPGVPLAKLREIGLRMQIGGVGYYPTSGSPFVHMDTGGVRMWPRMTREQLVRVFPRGRTLYIPADGTPLPGYAEALAAYKARKDGSQFMLASNADEIDDAENASDVTTRAVKAAADAGDANLIREVPRPRLAQRPIQAPPVVVAMVEAGTDVPVPSSPPANHALSFFDRVFGLDAGAPAAKAPPPRLELREVDFDVASDVSTPVPTALAAAMAARDRSGRMAAPASLPIRPTAIVATIDIARPLRAEAMTTAVLRKGGASFLDTPPVLAYAAVEPAAAERPRPAKTLSGVPIPQVNPRTRAPAAAVAAEVAADDLYGRLPAAELTLTALDTQGLRLWMATQSTREKRYALLTMPDFGQVPSLLDKPAVTYAADFGDGVVGNLRTDHFSGPVVQPPAVVDLTRLPAVASR
jgi:uncharacterized protein YcbK (DUF882 family)